MWRRRGDVDRWPWGGPAWIAASTVAAVGLAAAATACGAWLERALGPTVRSLAVAAAALPLLALAGLSVAAARAAPLRALGTAAALLAAPPSAAALWWVGGAALERAAADSRPLAADAVRWPVVAVFHKARLTEALNAVRRDNPGCRDWFRGVTFEADADGVYDAECAGRDFGRLSIAFTEADADRADLAVARPWGSRERAAADCWARLRAGGEYDGGTAEYDPALSPPPEEWFGRGRSGALVTAVFRAVGRDGRAGWWRGSCLWSDASGPVVSAARAGR
jgi:hypothetical protein